MTYPEALAAGDLLARFCATQLARFLPDADPGTVYTNATAYGLTGPQLGHLVTVDPDHARKHLAQ